MDNSQNQYRIFPLGDSALTIDFGNCISRDVNQLVTDYFKDWMKDPFPGMIDLVPAYCSLTIYFDSLMIQAINTKKTTAAEWMKMKAEERLLIPSVQRNTAHPLLRIPVCYSGAFAPDLAEVAISKILDPDEVIQIHSSRMYRVYMLGFLPGFAYLGELDERITMPRKMQPVPVVAGSIGIAGRQTGMYPFDSPGGWQIIGRTPLNIFDSSRSNPCLLQAGDDVQFFSVDEKEYQHLRQSAAQQHRDEWIKTESLP